MRFSKIGIKAHLGGHEVDACRVGYSRTLRMVCYYLRVSQNCSVVLLVKLKDVIGVLDGDRVVLGKNEIYP